jgi:deoxyribose-phosphate aldolase
VGHHPNLDDPRAVAALIDHTLLKPEATSADVLRMCAEAREWKFASVCINPCWVPLAGKELAGSESRVCTVIGFPLGANSTRVKLFEAEHAIDDGATELDVVQNIGALRSGDTDLVRNEIRAIAELVHARNALVKVIIETSLLSEDQKVASCMLALEAGADFVKTSTGFSSGGATAADVKLMRRTVDSKAGVKASGGVRTLDALRHMVRAGANRIGTSSGVSIVRELSVRADAAQQARPEATH